jgi:hypothetical protein
MLLNLGPKQVLVIVSIHVSLRTPTGYLLPDDMEQAHIKMCHIPKILECEINKIGTMFACLDLKFHRELIFLIYLKASF